MLHRTIAAALVGLATAPAAVAQDWQGQFTIYGWLPAIAGEQEREDGRPLVEISTKDVLEALDFAFFASGEVRRGKFGALFDMSYARLSSSGDVDRPVRASADVKTTVAFAQAAASWRFYETEPRRFAEAYAGIRAYDTEASFDVSVGPFSGGRKASSNWVDPIIGLRGSFPLSERWSVSALGDVGGFDAASDLSWELYGGANYAFNEHFSGVLGYRYMSITHEDDDLSLDINIYGPLVGVTYRF